MRLASTPLILAGAAAALAFAAQPAAAARAVNGELNIVADAYINGGPTVTQTDSQNWSGAPTTLNVTATAHATNGVFRDHNQSVTSFGTAQATWASANAGAVDFTNYGWNFSVTDPNTGASGADLDQLRPGSGADWLYAFQATGDGVFQMDYNVSASGNTLGLFGWAIDFNGVSVGPDLTDPAIFGNDPTTSGIVTEAVTAGQFYTVALYGNPNIAGSGVQQFSNSMDGTFDWRITERGGVPEPASWALMLVGFGGMGAMLRARRKLATATA